MKRVSLPDVRGWNQAGKASAIEFSAIVGTVSESLVK